MKFTLKEIQKWLRGLEENKWRKRYKVDAKRITHYANLGEDTDLPLSLQRKSEGATYGREKSLAKRFKEWVRNQQKVQKVNEHYKLKSYIRKIVRESIRG